MTDTLVETQERVVNFGDGGDIPLKTNCSLKGLEGTKTSISRMFKKAVSIGMYGGRKLHQLYTEIYPGAEQELIGGVIWHILHLSDLYEPLQGIFK